MQPFSEKGELGMFCRPDCFGDEQLKLVRQYRLGFLRVGTGAGLPTFLKVMEVDPLPQHVKEPRSNPYVFWEEEEVNRNLERAGALSARFGSLTIASWEDLPALASFDLVINATSLGHEGRAPALQQSVFAPGAVCYDLNYYKASEPLKALCETMGQRYIDGLGMLVEQAAHSFGIWTGKRPDSSSAIKHFRK